MKTVKSFIQKHTSPNTTSPSTTTETPPPPPQQQPTTEHATTSQATPEHASPVSMSASMKTILILGGTSGIGAAFAKRFHGQGKKVIVTGRREARLNQLKADAPGLEGYVMDNNDIPSIPKHLDTLFKTYPDIDTVWINGGIQRLSSIKDLDSTTDAEYELEVTTNVTAPFILSRHIVPKLIARGAESNLLFTSSALGFAPMPQWPVYVATKAAGHSFMVAMRQSLKDTNVNVIEIVPPYTATELDDEWKHKLPAHVKPMPLAEFEENTFAQLDKTPAKELKEVGTGSAQPRIDAWREGVGALLEKWGLGG